jgi:hypothetical protein
VTSLDLASLDLLARAPGEFAAAPGAGRSLVTHLRHLEKSAAQGQKILAFVTDSPK